MEKRIFQLILLLMALAGSPVLVGMNEKTVVATQETKRTILPSLAQLASRQYLIRCINNNQHAEVRNVIPNANLAEHLKACPWAASLFTLQIPLYRDLIEGVAWSPDGTRIATISGTTLKVTHGETGAKLFIVPHKERVASLDWSPDGSKIVTACDDGVMRVVDSQTGKIIRTKTLGHLTYNALWSPDGGKIAVVVDRHRLCVIDSQTGDIVANVQHGPNEKNPSMFWSPTGNHIATVIGQVLRILDCNTKQVTVLQNPAIVRSMQWQPEGKKVIIVSSTAEVFDIETGKRFSFPQKHKYYDYVHSIEWTADGTKQVIHFKNKKLIQIVDLINKKTVSTFSYQEVLSIADKVEHVQSSPDGNKLLVVSEQGIICIVHIETAQVLATIECKELPLLQWSPDGSKLVTAFRESVMIHEGNTGLLLAQEPLSKCFQVQWSPDSQKVIAITKKGVAKIVGIPALPDDQFIRSVQERLAEHLLKLQKMCDSCRTKGVAVKQCKECKKRKQSNTSVNKDEEERESKKVRKNDA